MGQYVVPRIVGAILITAALIALAFARLDHAEARRRSLNRFASAHVVFGVLFSGIAGALLTPNLPVAIVWGPLVVGIVLSSFAVVNAQGRSGSHAGIDTLRSQYDAQIRQAARREERARLARDLHDAVRQQLFAIQTAAAEPLDTSGRTQSRKRCSPRCGPWRAAARSSIRQSVTGCCAPTRPMI